MTISKGYQNRLRTEAIACTYRVSTDMNVEIFSHERSSTSAFHFNVMKYNCAVIKFDFMKLLFFFIVNLLSIFNVSSPTEYNFLKTFSYNQTFSIDTVSKM